MFMLLFLHKKIIIRMILECFDLNVQEKTKNRRTRYARLVESLRTFIHGGGSPQVWSLWRAIVLGNRAVEEAMV